MEDERGRRVRTKEPVREQTRFAFEVPDEAITTIASNLLAHATGLLT